ncbi:TetR family transcriptional regulator C-terminal domain-containing protein [Pseudomonas sp.]|uniref:TetR family transcriptional regulator C-terminal domain-containing protein n=1 Tax=Pseudomonas sp. TaxID=306 RepID=UPI0028B0F199|nr:TetR family transcriptional regulator C-terminal domain-containing protein [Pseudomonas sp.]
MSRCQARSAGGEPAISKRGQRRRDYQALILDAAQTEFSRFGYDGASLKNIARRAHLPKANVLYYFKDKQTLFGSVLKRVAAQWKDPMEGFDAADCPRATLRSYIREKLTWSRDQPEASRLLAGEILAVRPQLNTRHGLDHALWFSGRMAVFEEWIARGALRPIDPVLLVFTIWGATQFYADYAAGVELLTGRNWLDGAGLERTLDFLEESLLIHAIP